MQSGTMLAHYRVGDLIGKGGMGEVYGAHDTKLARDVALKILPPEFADDMDRLARFEREAKVLASLHHPNVASVFGFERGEDCTFLVMELVDGEDLAEVLRRGPLPVDEAVDIARQIAEGLEEAHEKGIVHRDLKPANVKRTTDGRVKVLDFGLARAFAGQTAGEEDISSAPTMAAAVTQVGTVLGTAAYMSPEQARGKEVDRRADIWAFGVILFEMLTGEQVFAGETASDTLAGILKSEPEWDRLPGGLPFPVERVLRRCLAKDPRQRLRDIGEARVRLERWQDDPAAIHDSKVSSPAFLPVRRRAALLPWVITGLAVCAALWSAWRSAPDQTAVVAHAEWILEAPFEDDIPRTRVNVLLSPDGNWCGWVTSAGIRVRRIDSADVALLPETADSEAVCFSPDSRWLAFISRGGIYRISVAGGAPFRLGDSPNTRGITWVDDHTLVMTNGIATGLTALDLETGATRAITTPDTTRAERSHRWPSVVPGRRAVLFECQILGRDYDSSDIDYVDLDTGERRTIMRGGAMPQARVAGHLLFVRSDVIYAVELDLDQFEIRGLPVPVREGLVSSVGNQEDDDGSAQFALDRRGNLFYLSAMGGRDLQSQLAWLTFADGEITPITDFEDFGLGMISPNGEKLAVAIRRDGDWNIVVRDLVTGNELALTSRPSAEYPGAWSPDSRVFYWSQSSPSGDRFEVWSRPADGSLPESFVAAPGNIGGAWANSVSPDGAVLGVSCFVGADRFDIKMIDLTSDPPRADLLIGGSRSERDISFDDSGRYFFYAEGAQYFREDDAAGGNILLRRFPDSDAVWSLPDPGGGLHSWIWCRARSGVVAVHEEGVFLLPVLLDADTPTIGTARQLMDLRTHLAADRISRWRLHPDGERAIINLASDRTDDGSAPSLVMVTDWDDLVAQKLREASD